MGCKGLRAYLISSASYLAGFESRGLTEEEIASKAIAAVDRGFSRALQPMVLIAAVDGGVGAFADALDESPHAEEARRVQALLEGADLSLMAEARAWPDGLSRDYWKHLDSYRTIAHEEENRRERARQAARTVSVLVRRGLVTAENVSEASGVDGDAVAALSRGNVPEGVDVTALERAARAAKEVAAQRSDIT